MLYVVSGWMRSGSSMMMRALEAGGLEAVYRQSRDEMKQHFADEHYDPNLGGLYELNQEDYAHPDFPRMYDGKLIKALRLGPGQMRTMPSGIRVIFMLRDPEEQRQSYMGFFGGTPPTAAQIQATVDRSLEAARNRRDSEVLTLNYHEVIADAKESLQTVADFLDYPLDVQAAAATVDPMQYRYRLENLIVGIS